MTIATGIAKKLTIAKETTFATAAGAGTGQSLRRVTSTLALTKQTYASAEIRSDYQVSDFRHGVRSVAGAITGELSPLTHQLAISAALRKLFVATAPTTGASITIAGVGPTYTVTRAAGSWLTDGVKIGDVGQLSAGAFNAANIAKNLFIVSLTATVMTVLVLSGTVLVAEGPITASTFTVMGKKAFVPQTGHTNDSFTIEHWHSDVAQSELFVGNRLSQLAIGLPPTGMATIAATYMGINLTTGTAQYFTAPTAPTTSGVLASVNGVVSLGGSQIALLTGLTLTINPNMTALPVVGSNVYPDIFPGRVNVTGQATLLFQDAIARDYFVNETEVALNCAFSTSNAANADFMGFSMPRVKMGGAAKDDGEKGLVQTMPFQALFNGTLGGAANSTDATTLSVQDSLAA